MLNPTDPFTVVYRPLNEPMPRQSGTGEQIGEYWVRWEAILPDGTAQTFNTYYRKDPNGGWVQARPLHAQESHKTS